MKRPGFSQKNRKPLKRSSFKRRYSARSVKIKLGRKKSTRVKLVPLGKLQRTCNGKK